MGMKKTQKKPAHRPLKYGEETIVYRRRVPKSQFEKVKDAVENILKKKVV
jgi:hypothetical protein